MSHAPRPRECRNVSPEGYVCELYVNHHGAHKDKHLRHSWHHTSLTVPNPLPECYNCGCDANDHMTNPNKLGGLGWCDDAHCNCPEYEVVGIRAEA